MSALQELLLLPATQKEAMGISATAAEIAQQPETWKGTRQVFARHRDGLRAFLEAAGVRGPAEQHPIVILVGAGSSDYIGRALTMLLRAEWCCETLAIPSTDLLASLPEYLIPGRRYIFISFSRSGDSTEGVNVLVQALEKYPQIAHLVVSCNEQGRMAELTRNHPHAYAVVLDDAVNDRGLAMTSSFTNMVVFGQHLAHLWTEEAYASGI